MNATYKFLTGEVYIDWDKTLLDLEILASEVIGYPGWRQFREGDSKVVNTALKSCK